jgi:peptidoglycan/xylan/chitin deacetylase (PgdA/CDA1 family)
MAFPDAARAIVRDGHELGNHSLTHPYFSRIGYDGAASELDETERIVRETTGATTRPYFRFPYGDSTADMVALVARHGYIAYHWSVDDGAIDGWIANVVEDPDSADGAIVLMHGRTGTAEKVGSWVDELIAAGLHPTTLSEALR